MDMLAGAVLTLHGTGQVQRRHVGAVAAMLRARRCGGVVLAVERGLAFADDELRTVEPLPPLWHDPSVRMNEGSCAPDGTLYCGSMAYNKRRGTGTLYRMDVEEHIEVALPSATVSNGLAWSLDGTTAYYVDTATNRTDVFDWQHGLARRRPLVRIPADQGAPDGLTVDADGSLWVALWGGGTVHRYSPRGRLEELVELPVTQVTSCTFGGPDHATLFITTSRDGIPPGEQPCAGAVFTIAPGVRGLPVMAFVG